MLYVEDELDSWTPRYVALILATRVARNWSYVVFWREPPGARAP